MWQTWRAYIAKEKQLKKKLAKEEKERLKRAKENAKKRASRDKLKAQEQAAKEAAAAEKAAKEPPKQKKRRQFAAGDVFRSRVTAGHKVIDEEKIDLDQKSPEKPDPYAEDRRKQSAQLKKIQGYLHRAQTIVKEVRIQQAAEKEEDEREARRKAREEMEMKAFLEDKDEAFAEAHQRALEWTDDFAVYAEKKCVETLQRVQREAQAHYDKQLLRQSLRLIRLPWAEKRAISLMNRQKMRNLLRLCAGWRKVDRSMPKYWRLRSKLCGNQPDNSSLSHSSAMTLPSRLRRAVRNRHRHAIEQASRRWRGRRRDDSARTRRKILISTQARSTTASWTGFGL